MEYKIYKSKYSGKQVDDAIDQIPNKVDKSLLGAVNGVATLDSRGKVPKSQIPDGVGEGVSQDYVDNNFVKKDTTRATTVYGHNAALEPQMFYVSNNNGNPNWIAMYDNGGTSGKTEPVGSGRISSKEPLQPYQLANKKYVDDAIAAGTGTVDGTSIVKDADGKIQLNQEYIDYLDNQLYQPPAISVFTMLDAAGTALPTNNEQGTVLNATALGHQETNIKNIDGNIGLYVGSATQPTITTTASDKLAQVKLGKVLEISATTKYILKGKNTKESTFSKDYQINFYQYAYTATTTATTVPTSGATQQAAVSTFASNGNTFNYTKGDYIYFYTDNTGKKVQTNVLGQWADVDTTDMGKVTLTQKNGVTHEYTCYRIGPFIETGSAKYRV